MFHGTFRIAEASGDVGNDEMAHRLIFAQPIRHSKKGDPFRFQRFLAHRMKGGKASRWSELIQLISVLGPEVIRVSSIPRMKLMSFLFNDLSTLV